jgi:hypothetical protein
MRSAFKIGIGVVAGLVLGALPVHFVPFDAARVVKRAQSGTTGGAITASIGKAESAKPPQDLDEVVPRAGPIPLPHP